MHVQHTGALARGGHSPTKHQLHMLRGSALQCAVILLHFAKLLYDKLRSIDISAFHENMLNLCLQFEVHPVGYFRLCIYVCICIFLFVCVLNWKRMQRRQALQLATFCLQPLSTLLPHTSSTPAAALPPSNAKCGNERSLHFIIVATCN